MNVFEPLENWRKTCGKEACIWKVFAYPDGTLHCSLIWSDFYGRGFIDRTGATIEEAVNKALTDFYGKDAKVVKYTVITKETTIEYGFDPLFWKSRPEWIYYFRSDIRSPMNPNVWLGGGGKTKEEAYANMMYTIRLCVPKDQILNAIESETPIMNEV